MKIILSKLQWQQIGKTAGWIFNFCAWCGQPIEEEMGVKDPFCGDKKCKIHDLTTPDTHRTISDGVCEKCIKTEMIRKDKQEYPYNINKGKTPKDVLIKDIKKQKN